MLSHFSLHPSLIRFWQMLVGFRRQLLCQNEARLWSARLLMAPHCRRNNGISFTGICARSSWCLPEPLKQAWRTSQGFRVQGSRVWSSEPERSVKLPVCLVGVTAGRAPCTRPSRSASGGCICFRHVCRRPPSMSIQKCSSWPRACRRIPAHLSNFLPTTMYAERSIGWRVNRIWLRCANRPNRSLAHVLRLNRLFSAFLFPHCLSELTHAHS